MVLVSGCKDCKDRKTGCHSVCEKYKKFRSELDKINEEKHRQQEVDDYIRILVQRNRARGLKKNKRFTRHND